MVSNDEIRLYMKEKYDIYAKNGWIAHAKDVYGIPLKSRQTKADERKWKCPTKRLEQFKEAFIHFNMLNNEQNQSNSRELLPKKNSR